MRLEVKNWKIFFVHTVSFETGKEREGRGGEGGRERGRWERERERGREGERHLVPYVVTPYNVMQSLYLYTFFHSAQPDVLP